MCVCRVQRFSDLALTMDWQDTNQQPPTPPFENRSARMSQHFGSPDDVQGEDSAAKSGYNSVYDNFNPCTVLTFLLPLLFWFQRLVAFVFVLLLLLWSLHCFVVSVAVFVLVTEVGCCCLCLVVIVLVLALCCHFCCCCYIGCRGLLLLSLFCCHCFGPCTVSLFLSCLHFGREGCCCHCCFSTFLEQSTSSLLSRHVVTYLAL